MKKLLAVAILLASSVANAEIIYQKGVKMTQINAYDDSPTVGAFVYLSANHADCPNGVYINPTAENYNSLYSTVLSAFIAGKTVDFQLYNDRITSGRCEVDGVWVFAN